MKTVLCLSLALAVNAEIVQSVRKIDSVKTADAKVADAPQLVYTPLTADEMKANAIVQSKLFTAGLDKSPLAMKVMLPLKCSVRNCKDWNCGTWCWCFENYGDQIQAWLDVYAARAGCLADEEDCICKPDGPGPVGPEGDPIDINVVPREWVRRPSQCCVHPAPPPLDSSPSLRARLATLITLHSSTHYMTQSRRRFAKSSSLRNSHTSASTRRASRMALAPGGSPLTRKLLQSSASLICTYPSAATISRRTIASASRIHSTVRCKRFARKWGARRTALRWFSSRQWR